MLTAHNNNEDIFQCGEVAQIDWNCLQVLRHQEHNMTRIQAVRTSWEELLGSWILSIVRYSTKTLENKTFRKLDLFLSSDDGGERHLLCWVR
jgi:hypothetical protein